MTFDRRQIAAIIARHVRDDYTWFNEAADDIIATLMRQECQELAAGTGPASRGGPSPESATPLTPDEPKEYEVIKQSAPVVSPSHKRPLNPSADAGAGTPSLKQIEDIIDDYIGSINATYEDSRAHCAQQIFTLYAVSSAEREGGK